MKIHFSCPKCNTTYSAEPHQAGNKGKCKKCGQLIEVPYEQYDEVKPHSEADSKPGSTPARKFQTIGVVLLVVGLLAIVASLFYVNQRLKYISTTEEQFLYEINEDIEVIETKISATSTELEKYSSGLLVALLQTRLQILNANLDLLQQRKSAKKYKVEINYKGQIHPYKDENHKKQLLDKIEAAMAEQKTELIKNQGKSELYSSGLIKNLIETAMLTNQIAINMLEAKRLAIVYDIPLFLVDIDEKKESSALVETNQGQPKHSPQENKFSTHWIKSSSANIRTEPSTNAKIVSTMKQGEKVRPTESQGDWMKVEIANGGDGFGWIHSSLLSKSYVNPEPTIKIVEIDARVTEKNNSWWKYAWKLTIRNSGTNPVSLSATIKFQDKDGFIIEEDNEYGLVVPSGTTKTFTGYELIDTEVAVNVTQIGASVE